jgi:DNA repair protein RadB
MPTDRLETGSPGLDRLLGGGLEPDCLTEIYGEGGTGKTIFCLQVALRVALGGRWVFYIDTEGVSVDRLEAMAGARLHEALTKLLLSSPESLADQTRAVRTAAARVREGSRPVGLIVLDSATFFYRLSLGSETEDAAREALGLQLAELATTALHALVPVVFTNQVWRHVSDGTLEPLGGAFLNHVAKTILSFERQPGDRRRAFLVKNRSQPRGSVDFRITARGLE